MSIFQVETGTAHGRGFSREDSEGYLAKLASFLMRPASNGSSQNFTANASTDELTCSSHGYSDGDPVIVTSTTTLPTPLAESTEYYIIVVDANTFQLAETHGDAIDGTEIDLTDTGSGTHSVYAAGGGAEWYLFDDMSDATGQTFATTDVNTSTDQITITGHGLHTGQLIWFTSTDTVPAGLGDQTERYAIRIDANTIEVATSYSNAISGTSIDITSQGVGTHTMTPREQSMMFCNTASPTANDIDTDPSSGPPKFMKISMLASESGYIRIQFAMWHNTTTHFTYGYWFGQRVATYDDADFPYYFRGGEQCVIAQSRYEGTYYCAGMDEFVGDSNLLEGTDKYGILQSGASAGSSVVLQLDTGEAANITVDKYYYLWDFNDTSFVQYVKVTARDLGTDQVTIETLAENVASGAVLSAYTHRWVGFGNGKYTSDNMCQDSTYDSISKIPYCSSYNSGDNSYCFHDQVGAISGAIQLCEAGEYLSTMNPDDEGNYAVMRPGITEYYRENTTTSSVYTEMNRGYGVLRNTYMCMKNSMVASSDGYTINSTNYLYFNNDSEIFNNGSSLQGILFLDSESTS